MKFTPFTLEEAEEIREDFEDLVDTEFKIGSSALLYIEDIVITPFGEDHKKDFAGKYSTQANSEDTISSYKGDDYDVILITCEAGNETAYSYIGIREFAALRGIKYSFP